MRPFTVGTRSDNGAQGGWEGVEGREQAGAMGNMMCWDLQGASVAGVTPQL